MDKFAREPPTPLESRTFVLTNVTTYGMLCDANQVKNCYGRDTPYCNATDVILNQHFHAKWPPMSIRTDIARITVFV